MRPRRPWTDRRARTTWTKTSQTERSQAAALRRGRRRAAGRQRPQARKLGDVVQGLLADGFDPIVFCRFIHTADYVAEHLRTILGKTAPSSASPAAAPSERETRIDELAARRSPRAGRHRLPVRGSQPPGRFQAVVHYDLAWNPTRHEQREGRVDRFGQAATPSGPSPSRRRQPDRRIVMRVLIRKHEEIRKSLGVSVPVPNFSNHVVEALMEELLTSNSENWEQLPLDGFSAGDLHVEWESSAAKERASRTKFAQAGIKPDEVARELAEIRDSLGSAIEIEGFVRESLDALGSSLTKREHGFTAVTATLPPGLKDALPPGHAQHRCRSTAIIRCRAAMPTWTAPIRRWAL